MKEIALPNADGGLVHAILIAARHAPMGRGINGLGGSAKGSSYDSISLARTRCCSLKAIMTSGESGGACFAITCVFSAARKFTARITSQTAARPAQAWGQGHRSSRHQHEVRAFVAAVSTQHAA